MPIADDWDFDYPNKILAHIDGILNFDGGTAGVAVVGDYIRGGTSGAIGKVLAVTGSAVSGTWTLTNVVGLFEDGEIMDKMSVVGFDTVTDLAPGVQGIHIGDTVTDQVTGSIVVRAIEYNEDGSGEGRLYGDSFVAFTDDSSLDVDAPVVQTGVALVHTAQGNTDNDAVFDNQAANGDGLVVPGTAQTNDSVIIHYDTGTVDIPEQAIIEDAVSGAIGLVEQVTGVTATGSVRVVDYNSTGGVFANGNTLRLDQVIGYNNQVAGQVFSVGDVIVGLTSGATGRVLADTGTQLILADESGTWTTTEDIEVNGVKIADANGTNATINVAVCDLPQGIREEQRPTAVGGNAGQGGVYAIDGVTPAASLNIIRKFNSLYTLSQDTFDELVQLDDDEALDASVKGGAYQIVFDWVVPDLSFRFTRQGGITNTSGSDVWANPQTVGVQNKITAFGFNYDSTTQNFRMPQLYIEQNQEKIPTHWLEGQIDVMIKVRSRQDTRFIDPATPGLGQLVPGGDPAIAGAYAVYNREYHTSTYDTTQFNAAAGGVNTVALGTGDDTATDRNPNGTHTMNWNTGSAATLLVGEEFETTALLGNQKKVGQVVAQTGDAGATGTLEYVLKSGTQFLTTEALIGTISGKTFLVNGAPTGVVAGYVADIAFPVVDQDHTGGTIAGGPFFPGEPLSDVGGWTGRFIVAVGDTIYSETVTGSPDDSLITGGESGATVDPTANSTELLFNADLNNGDGLQPYAGTVSMDLTGGNAESMQNGYQYSKYLTRAEEIVYIFNGPGTADTGTIGRFFRKLKDAYAEVKPGSPMGPYTGSWALAQGWFLDTNYVDAADIRSFSVIDDNGVPHAPPNLQSLTISGVANGWRVAAYRSTGSGLTTILRTEFDVGAVGGGFNQSGDSNILIGAQDRTVSPTPSDVPTNGVIRVLDPDPLDQGNYLRFPYTAVDRVNNDFPLTAGTIGAVSNSLDLILDDNLHVVFIEQQAAGASVTNTIQYVADIPIVYKARLKGFKPFRSTGTFTNAGVTLGVVQTVDTIVDLP